MQKKSAYVDWYRTWQVCLQAPYKLRTCSIHLQRINVVEKLTTYRRCRGLHRNSWVLYWVYPSCRKIYNVDTLSIFLQLGYTFHTSFTFSETCTHLVQATYIARDWGICHARAHHHTRSNTHHQKKTTTTHNSQVLLPDHGRCPPRQALGTSW